MFPWENRVFLNFKPESRRINIQERILVSEIDKVRVIVDPKKTTDKAAPDNNGFVSWQVEIAGNSTMKIHLAYEIKKHPDVIGTLI